MNENQKIAHLGFIQGVITRMAGNSLALKGSAMALTVGVTALMGASNNFNGLFILAAIIPVIVFWIMDAQYLRLERKYRKLYEAVRHEADIEAFSMNPQPFSNDVASLISIAFSWSVIWFYLVLVVNIVAAYYLSVCS